MTHDQSTHAPDDEVHEHDLGLQHDLDTLRRRGLARGMGRRGLLGALGGLGVVAVAGCAADETPAPARTSSATPTASATASPSASASASASASESADDAVDTSGGEIPEETAGPFPGDGSNGPDALGESGVVRRDITRSFGSASGVADGVPLTLRMRVYDLAGDDARVLAGAAVYAWHCDREGAYSMYDGSAAEENYLRGVQVSDDDGWVEFATIFPGCYTGRWPHVHFEVYPSLDAATSASQKLRTSQLAFPADISAEVYATSGYEASVPAFADISLDSDMVFSDGYSLQMATMRGSVADGWTATLNVPV